MKYFIDVKGFGRRRMRVEMANKEVMEKGIQIYLNGYDMEELSAVTEYEESGACLIVTFILHGKRISMKGVMRHVLDDEKRSVA